MFDELRFIKSAIATKAFIPAFTHIKIKDQTVRAFDGEIAMGSPIAIDIDCIPKAIPFIKAIETCSGTISLSLTKTNRVSIKSGSFKAFIDCLTGETPHVTPEGEKLEIDGNEFLAVCNVLWPFIGNDASRRWTNGLYFNGDNAYVTNNIILIEHHLKSKFPIVCNIPDRAIKEIIRIGESPTCIQVTETHISFHFKGDRWLRTNLLATNWPDIGHILNKSCKTVPIVNEMFTALDAISSFSKDNSFYIKGNDLYSYYHNADEEGAIYNVPNLNIEKGVYNLDMFMLLKDIIKHADFSLYPDATLFSGDNLRGAIIGKRIHEE